MMSKILLIDKPKGITSHDVVYKVRKATGEKKVGHAGTLDPNATGLLIVGVGREATKKLGEITKNTNKTYDAEIVLGESRTTDDIEGEVIKKFEVPKPPTLSELKEALQLFIGEINQTPPQFSAIKIKGKKAYEMARKGKEVKLAKRKVKIYSLKLIEYKYPKIVLTAEVSSGTYIRALARDIGEKLQTGGYLNNLRRTRIGKYSVNNAKKLEEL